MLSNFNYQAVIQFFHTYPHSGGIIAFFIVFLEALAVVGSVIPGAILMPTLGFLIGSSVIPVGSTFLFALCGAFCGDYLSYLLGVHFQSKIHRLWPFSRHPKLLDRSEEYFRNHGGKSIFLGRFIGPMRAMIPMVAGMMKMRQSRFILAAIPSGAIWVALYLFPGVLLGALSLELPPKAATKFTLYVLLAAILVWILCWLLKHFFMRVCNLLDIVIKKTWEYLQRNKATHWFTSLLADPREPDNHSQLTLLILAALCAVIFVTIFVHLLTKGVLTSLNEPLYYLLTSLRLPILDHLMVAATLFGDEKTLLLAATIIFVWMIAKRYWYIAVHWFALVALCVAGISELKKIIFSPRPPIVAAALHTSSFPSGHTALTITLFGFLAVIIARELPVAKRRMAYYVAALLTVIVGFSRLYLGAHWLSDVFGSVFLGLTIVLLVTVAYRRRHTVQFSPRNFAVVVGSIFIFVWLGHGVIAYKKQYHDYALSFPSHIISRAQFQERISDLPLYRLNRLGVPIQIFNVHFFGNIDSLKEDLLAQGWQEQPAKLDFQGVIRTFSVASVNHHFPLLPQLHQNQSPVLRLTKATEQNDALLILTFWQSNVFVEQTFSPIWIGSIEYHRASPKIFSLHHLKNKAPFVGATELLQKYLRNYRWYQDMYVADSQPKEMLDLHWDGKMLLIEPKDSLTQRSTIDEKK